MLDSGPTPNLLLDRVYGCTYSGSVPNTPPAQPELDRFVADVWTWFLAHGRAYEVGRYGADYGTTEHLRACTVDTSVSGLPTFAHWDEWGGSLNGTERASGLLAQHVSCTCGQVRDADIASEESMPLTDIVRGITAARTIP